MTLTHPYPTLQQKVERLFENYVKEINHYIQKLNDGTSLKTRLKVARVVSLKLAFTD